MPIDKDKETKFIVNVVGYSSVIFAAFFCTNFSDFIVVGIAYAMFMSNFRMTKRYQDYLNNTGKHEELKFVVSHYENAARMEIILGNALFGVIFGSVLYFIYKAAQLLN